MNSSIFLPAIVATVVGVASAQEFISGQSTSTGPANYEHSLSGGPFPFRIYSSEASDGSVTASEYSGKYDIHIVAARGTTGTESLWKIEVTDEDTRLGTVSVKGYGEGPDETLIWILDEDNEQGNLLSVDLITDDPDGPGGHNPNIAGAVRVVRVEADQYIGSINVCRINYLIVQGDLGSISLTENSATTTLNFIDSLVIGGNLAGNILVPKGYVQQIVADGDIGSSSSPISIDPGEFILQLRANSIYATLDLSGKPAGNRRVGFIEARSGAGALAGNYKLAGFAVDFEPSQQRSGLVGGSCCDNFLSLDNELDPGMYVVGDVSADVEFLQIGTSGVVEINGSVTVEGDIFGSGSIASSGTLPESDSIVVLGTVSGDILIDGDLEGQIFAGSIASSGEIVIEGDVAAGSLLEIDGNLAGDVGIDADILGLVFVGGNLTSTADLYAHNLSGLLVVEGDVIGEIRLTGAINENSLLSIGGELAGTIELAVEEGLAGQIIIDAVGTTTTNEWLGDVALFTAPNTITLGVGSSQPYQAPYYSALPAVLGGGAIGEAPFNFHPIASAPMPVSTKLLAGTAEPVTIEHYGPVFRPESEESNAPLLIEFVASLDCTSGTGWTTIASSNFTFVIEDDPQTFDRTITITPAGSYQWIEGFYRMSPVADVVKCAWVDGNPDLGDYVYTSTLCAASGINDHFPVHVISGIGGMLLAMDMDESGWIDSPDAAAWINDPQDFDGDEIADANDLMMLVLHYGQQVPE